MPRDKGYKVTDSAGPHLFVSPGGGKSWRFKYTFGGKERRVVFGPYPEITLKRAREMRDDAKRLLREGCDPGLESKRARHTRRVGHENTFEMFARSWHEQQKDAWKEVHANDVITSMERDLFPAIGAFPVSEIDEGLLLAALREVEKRGAIETAHRLRQRAEKVFRFAAGAGAPNANPAVNVRDAMKPVPPKKRYPALTDVKQIRVVDRAGASPVTRLCSRFMALVAQRPGMSRLQRARGDETAQVPVPAIGAASVVSAARLAADHERLVRLDEVKHRTGMSRSTIYRRMDDGRFPKNVSISGNMTAWRERDISDWIANPD